MIKPPHPLQPLLLRLETLGLKSVQDTHTPAPLDSTETSLVGGTTPTLKVQSQWVHTLESHQVSTTIAPSKTITKSTAGEPTDRDERQTNHKPFWMYPQEPTTHVHCAPLVLWLVGETTLLDKAGPGIALEAQMTMMTVVA